MANLDNLLLPGWKTPAFSLNDLHSHSHDFLRQDIASQRLVLSDAYLQHVPLKGGNSKDRPDFPLELTLPGGVSTLEELGYDEYVGGEQNDAGRHQFIKFTPRICYNSNDDVVLNVDVCPVVYSKEECCGSTGTHKIVSCFYHAGTHDIDTIVDNLTRRAPKLGMTERESSNKLIFTFLSEKRASRRVYRWDELEKFLRRFLREFVIVPGEPSFPLERSLSPCATSEPEIVPAVAQCPDTGPLQALPGYAELLRSIGLRDDEDM
ncbi:hypothetical protein PENSPDRAFT_693111 [Peniophora sp. CONT]|nr:hypothetical protein PENSPDRAFT_693111 [Peniophora sp. CONT]